MDFNATVKKEMDKKYLDMLDGVTPSPFDRSVELSPYDEYEAHRKRYFERLRSEMNEYNAALKETQQNFRDRKDKEYEKMNKSAKNGFNFSRFLKLIVFLLPVILAALVGFDVFYPNHIYIDIAEAYEIMPFWAICLVYAIYAAICLIVTLVCVIKLFTREKFADIPRRDEFAKYESMEDENRRKRLRKIRRGSAVKATFIFLLSAALVACNVTFAIIGTGTNDILFTNGETKRLVEYQPGDRVSLRKDAFIESDDGESAFIFDKAPKYEGAQDMQTSYSEYYGVITEYEWKGWDIEGTFYSPFSSYIFEKNLIATAVYDEEVNYKLIVSGHPRYSSVGSNALSVTQNGIPIQPVANDSDYSNQYYVFYIPAGSTVRVTFNSAYEYWNEQFAYKHLRDSQGETLTFDVSESGNGNWVFEFEMTEPLHM